MEKRYNHCHCEDNVPHPYNIGCYENFKHNFGDSCIGWFLPLPLKVSDGTVETMFNKWDCPMLDDPNDKENKTKLMPMLGVSINSISKEFYEWACTNIKERKEDAIRVYTRQIKQKFESDVRRRMSVKSDNVI